MQEGKELVTKSVFMFATNIFGKGIILLTNVLIARLLGAKTFGFFIYVFTFISFFPTISIFGLNTGLLSFITKLEVQRKVDEKTNTITFAIAFSTVLAIVIALLLYVNSEWISRLILNDTKYLTLLRSLSFFIVPFTLLQVLASVFQAKREMVIYSVSLNIIQPLMTLFSIVMFYYFITIKYLNILILSKYIGYVIATFFLLYMYKIKYKNLNINFKKYTNTYKLLIKFSTPLMISYFIMGVTPRLNILFLGHYYSDDLIAIYSAVLQVSTLISFLLVAVNQVFSPIASKLYHEGRVRELGKVYGKLTIFLFIIASLFTVFIYILGNEVMLLFGKEFVDGSIPLIILSVAQLFNALSGPCGLLNTMSGHPKVEIIVQVTSLILTLILGYILVKNYSLIGAAISTSIVIFISNGLRMLFLYKNLRFLPFKINY